MEQLIACFPTKKGSVNVYKLEELGRTQYAIRGPLETTAELITTGYDEEIVIGFAKSRASANIISGD